MVWCWIKHSDNFTGNFYRYRLGVVKKFKYFVSNEMHIIYYFRVSSLNRNSSLNSPDWWRCLSWFRLCLFEKQSCFRLHTNIKVSALSLFTSRFFIHSYKFLPRIWLTIQPSTTFLIDLHIDDTGLEGCVLWSQLWLVHIGSACCLCWLALLICLLYLFIVCLSVSNTICPEGPTYDPPDTWLGPAWDYKKNVYLISYNTNQQASRA
jgi:hypothetical protein